MGSKELKPKPTNSHGVSLEANRRLKDCNEDEIEIEASLSELANVAEAMLRLIPQNAVIALRGDLAAGKTTLVQEIARAKGVDLAVTSPTFSLQHSYGQGIYHYDLYRIDFDELFRLGMIEEFEKAGWHLVEWMDRGLESFLASAGYHLYQVTITPKGDRRIYRIGSIDA